jgi:hypothetical protein
MGAGESSGQYQSSALTGATIQFQKGKIKDLGVDLADHEPGMDKIEKSIRGISVDTPGFGLVGIGLSHAHDQIKNGAGDALNMARTVLKDYKGALAKLDDNYQKADKDSDGKLSEYGDDNPGGPGGPGTVPDPKMPDTTMPDTKIPDTKMPDTKLPDPTIPDPNLPDSDLPDSNLPDSNLPDSNLPDSNLPDSNLPDSNLPDSNLPDSNLPDSSLPDTNLADTKTPSIEDLLNHGTTVPDVNPAIDPTKTDLSSFDPTALPNATTTTGNPTGLPGTSSGYAGAGTQPGGAATGAGGVRGGSSGMSGMPFMPMGGGGGGGEQERDRDKAEFVRGDEADWLDDMDIAPPVIGE